MSGDLDCSILSAQRKLKTIEIVGREWPQWAGRLRATNLRYSVTARSVVSMNSGRGARLCSGTLRGVYIRGA